MQMISKKILNVQKKNNTKYDYMTEIPGVTANERI